MKNFKQFAFILILTLFLSSCATTSFKTAEKYNLDNQLEPVSEILKYNLMGWETVDNQSFILQTAPSQYYLIILTHPADQLMFTETISITHTGDMVKPGYDSVTVFAPPLTQKYVIYKIYKLKDREQIDTIRKQFGGK